MNRFSGFVRKAWRKHKIRQMRDRANVLFGHGKIQAAVGMKQEADRLEVCLNMKGSRVPLPGPIPPKPENPLLTKSALLPHVYVQRKGDE